MADGFPMIRIYLSFFPRCRIALVFRLALCFIFLAASPTSAQAEAEKGEKGQNDAPATLRIDPLLIAEANEVWNLIGSQNNPIWPGWDASATPLLFYLPGEQDVLVNHPHPPQGFRRYDGPVQFPGWRIYVKDGPTLIGIDGQNTSKDVGGERTLVVADTLSNMRQQVFGWVADPRPMQDKFQTFKYSDLATDPYFQLSLVVHEAFHVYQDKMAPDKGADEWLLLYYPVLSVQNNVGFALEGSALADALHATGDAEFRRAALRWLALRKNRRSSLPPKAVEYEDGVEFTEGLAVYTEYRLFQVLEGRRPGAAMSWAQGFAGYANLAHQREDLVDQVVKHTSGAINVNNDPYGTAPLRMRLYYSGMAMGVLLDRLLPGWQSRIFAPDSSLTSLLEEALKPSATDLEQALRGARSGAAYAELLKNKTKLADDGKAHVEAMVKEIESGPGIGLIVDYSQLAVTKLGMGVTPFGITVVDEERTIFTQIPIKVAFGQAGEVVQTAPTPLLRDTGRKIVRFRLPPGATRAEVEKRLESAAPRDGTIADLALDLPGATVKATKAQIKWSGDDLTIVMLQSDKKE